MREIKFRGRKIDTLEWVYGYYVNEFDHHMIYQKEEADVSLGIGNGLVMRQYDVKPKSVGQYTGLHDKEGKEIYEGDILSIDDSSSADYFGPYEPYFHILPVIYRYGGFCVHIDERAYGSFLDADVDHSLRDIIEDIGLEVEVIGNVYENPELMGEEE